MREWNNDNTISDEDLMEYLPDQIFPEVEDLVLMIDDTPLHIYGTDTIWALQTDIYLAADDGCMSFFILEK